MPKKKVPIHMECRTISTNTYLTHVTFFNKYKTFLYHITFVLYHNTSL